MCVLMEAELAWLNDAAGSVGVPTERLSVMMLVLGLGDGSSTGGAGSLGRRGGPVAPRTSIRWEVVVHVVCCLVVVGVGVEGMGMRMRMGVICKREMGWCMREGRKIS